MLDILIHDFFSLFYSVANSKVKARKQSPVKSSLFQALTFHFTCQETADLLDWLTKKYKTAIKARNFILFFFGPHIIYKLLFQKFSEKKWAILICLNEFLTMLLL